MWLEFRKPFAFNNLLKGPKVMSSLGYAFNARTVDPSQSNSGLPISDEKGHAVVIKSDDWKPTKAGDGYGLEFEVEIIDGAYRGNSGVFRLGLRYKSQQAADIAHGKLSALCHVIGQYDLDDSRGGTSQLHGKPFRIVVQAQKNNAEYTEVTKFLDINGNEPGKAGSQPPVNQPPALPAAAPFNQPTATNQPSQPGAWPAPGAAANQPSQPGAWIPPDGASMPQKSPWSK